LTHPVYKILPWETQDTKELAIKAFENGYKKAKGDKRTPEENLESTFSGLVQEFSYQEMMPEKYKKRIVFSSFKEGKENNVWNSPHDIILLDDNDKKITIDIKGTSTSTSILRTPDKVNFVLGYSICMHKIWYGYFPDYYIQMFWDVENGLVYFVGALSGKLVEDYVDGRRTPEYRGPHKLIMQKDFDATDLFKATIDPKYKLI
jgi:hypothetical protein